ncbi:hypothetical protein GLOIN_2v1480597 [Rhizophagus irregularis DAOM 181602=DAOM 197198]|uniref:Uncharacterized protein n=1 Tax=Rhizophagus irregularis (strain DAOM 181602 / DAOM 197198 / MUCL 43194) TaxID=747089 RepID=A0A2P4PTC9_RHIID|nr:hypothetical protein GLOIN_2v1480597 [Rhizophagus irregularis DAOM 181602=DAOM 197198]POG68627.1 hypothetical protein GLOIN_2v1480597 [Rhizophagus irregularis DAOM 181602=DAOM 197198]GET66859.1 hypothetical protein GLOIN_2v1480597 [Rhizophagus irregularis DAOM 181602=DAOM 197198]|eukprot:XP_025175493.1 hypothetical protein GLOIN_2v1480597 [Rhizophagus irregularis DAOM 181602=DAOM 197198]
MPVTHSFVFLVWKRYYRSLSFFLLETALGLDFDIARGVFFMGNGLGLRPGFRHCKEWPWTLTWILTLQGTALNFNLDFDIKTAWTLAWRTLNCKTGMTLNWTLKLSFLFC